MNINMNKIRQWIKVIFLWLGLETMSFAIESSWKRYVYDDIFDVKETPSRKEDESLMDWAENVSKNADKRRHALYTYCVGAIVMGFSLGKIGKLVTRKILEDDTL